VSAVQLRTDVGLRRCVAAAVPSRLTADRAEQAAVNAVLLAARRMGLGAAKELPVLTRARPAQRETAPHAGLGARPRRAPASTGRVPGSDWAANTRAARVGTMTVGRRVEQVRLVELTLEESVLRAWPVRIRQGARIMRDAGVVADLEPDSFAALAGRCTAFRIDPM
ncbi:hypothetical protein, partial [Pseudonocardia sp. GCM10023141]|uniref:hypothetical protein n=1 Tax=Pseudonocardia sp. GCM10023141 TaxID=3252653 RepID=UPI003606D738